MLRNAFNRNAQAICPNVLPFFSQLSQVTADINEYQTLVKQFFDNIRDIIIAENSTLSISKQDNKMIIKTYFECLRYLIQKIQNKKDNTTEEESIVFKLLEDNIVSTLKWCLTSTEALTTKYIFQHTATLVAFFDKQSATSTLYQRLLDKFWSLLFSIIPEELNKQDVSELYLERVIELINDLYVANPSLEEHKVKFVEDSNEESENTERPATPKEPHTTAAFIQKELKQLVLQLLRICLNKTSTMKTSKYIKHVRLLCNMFSDKDFFAKVSEDGKMETTLMTLVGLLKSSFLDNEACEIVVDVIFEVLQKLEKQQRFEFIDKELMKVRSFIVQF